MGLFSSEDKKKKKQEKALRENRARHKRWGMDFAPWVDDKDPDKWIDEYEVMDMITGDDEDEDW